MTLIDIPNHMWITQYVGEVITKAQMSSRLKTKPSMKEYLMSISCFKRRYYIDGSYPIFELGNRINHSCEPNCGFFTYIYNNELHIWAQAIKDIPRMSYLSVYYHDSYFEKHICLCGTISCMDRKHYGPFLAKCSSFK